MTRMTGPDCAVTCNLVTTGTQHNNTDAVPVEPTAQIGSNRIEHTGAKVVDPRRRTDKETPAFERRTRGSLGGTTAAMRAMGLEDVPRR